MAVADKILKYPNNPVTKGLDTVLSSVRRDKPMNSRLAFLRTPINPVDCSVIFDISDMNKSIVSAADQNAVFSVMIDDLREKINNHGGYVVRYSAVVINDDDLEDFAFLGNYLRDRALKKANYAAQQLRYSQRSAADQLFISNHSSSSSSSEHSN